VGDQNEEIVMRIEKFAKRKGCEMGVIAMARLSNNGACPIVGLNSEARIEQALEAFSVTLSQEVEILDQPYQPPAVQAV
jgi:aryl-alcohol dehydrogenase-like predicted oxidoreductase